MDPRAARGLAANIRAIAENTARIAMIDAEKDHEVATQAAIERAQCSEAVDRAESRISEWLMQPMTWR